MELRHNVPRWYSPVFGRENSLSLKEVRASDHSVDSPDSEQEVVAPATCQTRWLMDSPSATRPDRPWGRGRGGASCHRRRHWAIELGPFAPARTAITASATPLIERVTSRNLAALVVPCTTIRCDLFHTHRHPRHQPFSVQPKGTTRKMTFGSGTRCPELPGPLRGRSGPGGYPFGSRVRTYIVGPGRKGRKRPSTQSSWPAR